MSKTTSDGEFTCVFVGAADVRPSVSSAVLRLPDLLSQLGGQARVQEARVLVLVLVLTSLTTGARAGGHKPLLPHVQLRRDAQAVRLAAAGGLLDPSERSREGTVLGF